MSITDRRQRKTRKAVFSAFTELLAKKDFSHITVGEIISLADVGRATFYAHFETKDFLLRELCRELFDHIFESASGDEHAHAHIFDCEAPDSAFLHLLLHLKKNDNNILVLLKGQNNDLFLRYFKDDLKKLIADQLPALGLAVDVNLPKDFLVNHAASTFVETVRWWLDGKTDLSPETVQKYFLLALRGGKDLI